MYRYNVSVCCIGMIPAVFPVGGPNLTQVSITGVEVVRDLAYDFGEVITEKTPPVFFHLKCPADRILPINYSGVVLFVSYSVRQLISRILGKSLLLSLIHI